MRSTHIDERKGRSLCSLLERCEPLACSLFALVVGDSIESLVFLVPRGKAVSVPHG